MKNINKLYVLLSCLFVLLFMGGCLESNQVPNKQKGENVMQEKINPIIDFDKLKRKKYLKLILKKW